MKTLLLVLGMLALAMGGLWIGQGMGYVKWPETSMMLNDTKWAYYGGVLVVIGLLAIIYSRKSSPSDSVDRG